jgi:hypothetical protein
MRPRVVAAVLLALASAPVAAECTPADPQAITDAEARAADAERRAQHAESIAVRSGNPGAHARATQARAAADDARAEVERLRCGPASGAASSPPLAPRRSH